MNFKVIKSDLLYKGKVFDHKVDFIEYKSGNIGVREVAVHPGGAVVIPVKENGNLILVNQFRYPFQKNLLEFPAGKLDLNEDPLTCVIRELEEETGYVADNIEKLGSIYTAPGYCTEELHIYRATGLNPGKPNREEGEEGMELHEISPKEILELIARGEIKDAKTIAGIHFLNQKTG